MKIGIVIAIARELKAFLESDFKIEILTVCHKEIYKTNINGNEVYAIKSGYGQIDAAAATELLIACFGVEVILNFGVTGALKQHMKVEDLFLASHAVNYAYDVSPIDPVKPAQYEEFKDVYIPLDPSLIELARKNHPELKLAKVASGDRFIEKPEDKKMLRETFDCDICDMEVAAIARTCYLNEVKCLSIKCISDTLEGDGGDFNQNVVNSANKAFALLKEILFSL